MSEVATFIGLVWSLTLNAVFLLLGTIVFKRNIVDFIRRMFYAKKGYGLVYMVRRDKRIVEYFTKVTGEKIRINKNTYITNPDYLNFYSNITEKEDPVEKIVKLKAELVVLCNKKDSTSKNKLTKLFTETVEQQQKSIEKQIKSLEDFIKKRQESLVEVGSRDPTRMLLKGNMPCYFFKEGSIEPLNIIETKMGEISSKHMDDIVVDAQTAPRASMANWFAENKRSLMILAICVFVLMFILASFLQGNPDLLTSLTG